MAASTKSLEGIADGDDPAVDQGELHRRLTVSCVA